MLRLFNISNAIWILVYLLFYSGFELHSQTNNIQKRIYLSKSNNAYSRDIVETTPNEFVIIGQSMDSVGNILENHLTLIGVDSIGTLSWRKTYGGNKFTFLRLSATPKYIIKHGSFLYAALSIVDSNSRMLGSLTKFNFNGDTLWQKKFYETNQGTQSFFKSVCPSVDNGFLITGAIQNNIPLFNGHPTVGLYLLKTDANGNKLWDHTFYKSNLDYTQSGTDIIQDSLTKKIIIIGSQNQASGGSPKVMVLDSLGNILIEKGDGTGIQYFGDALTQLIQTKDDKFIAVGGVDYPPINGRSFLVKFDINADVVFSQEYDTINYQNSFMRVEELSDGTILTGGSFDTENKYTNGFNDIIRIMKLDKNGDFIWKKYFDNYTDNTNQDFLAGMCLTSNGDIAFTSFTEFQEPTPLTFMFYRTDTSYCDANAIACYNITGISDSEMSFEKNNIFLYPNPAQDELHLQFINDKINEFKNLSIYNNLGQLIRTEEVNFVNKQATIDLKGLENGIYQFILSNPQKEQIIKKIVVLN